MKSRQSFIKVIVYISLFLLLFSALSISVLYIGQSIQVNQSTSSTGLNLNDIINAELSGSNLIINEDKANEKSISGEAMVLPKGN